jgi:hypothetical protein
MTTTAPVSVTTDHAETGHPGRIRLVAAVLAAASAVLAVLVVAHPWGERLDSSADDLVTYDYVLEHHANAWPAMFADIVAFGLIAVCLAVGVAHLVRGRGRTLATVGAALVVLGGLLSAMGSFAFATVLYLVGELPEEAGRTLVDTVNDDVAHVLGAEMAGFLLVTLGSLVLAAALFRARAVPRLAIGLYVALTVALFAGLPGTAMDVAQAAQVVLAGALAVPLLRSASLGR